VSERKRRLGGPAAAAAAERTLGEKVEWLIRHRWPADAPPPRTNADVAEAITAATGEELSSTGVWKIRTGRGDNPTLKTLTAMARFFGVPVGYFGDEEQAESIGDELAVLELLRDQGFGRAALRSLTGLSAHGRKAVAEIIETISRMEQAQDRAGGSPETVRS
jgi:ESX-1-secreted protein regulator